MKKFYDEQISKSITVFMIYIPTLDILKTLNKRESKSEIQYNLLFTISESNRY